MDFGAKNSAYGQGLSPEAQSEIIEACKKSNDNDEDDKSLASNKSAKTIINSVSKMMKLLENDIRWLKKLVSVLQKHEEKTFDRESVLQGVSNDCGDSLLSSKMRYEYAICPS